MNSRQIAEAATIQSFLNCYLRETGNFNSLATDDPLTFQVKERTDAKSAIICPLPQQNIEILVGVKYWSPAIATSLPFRSSINAPPATSCSN